MGFEPLYRGTFDISYPLAVQYVHLIQEEGNTLDLSIEGAVPQAVQQSQRLICGEQPGGKDGNLPFKHLLQVRDGGAFIAQVQDVIGVIQVVVALVRAQRVLDVLPGQLKKSQQITLSQRSKPPG